MTYFAKASRTIVIKASRETIGLVAAASALTFVLAYAVHSRPTPVAAPVAAAVQQDWTGHLAELQPAPAAPDAALTSADLVVPKAQLALPAIPIRATTKRACDDPSCVKIPVPPRRVAALPPRTDSAVSSPSEPKPTLLNKLNPLNHLPPMSTVSKPFTYAGDVVSGWIKRF